MYKNKDYYLVKDSKRKLTFQATDPEKLLVHFTDFVQDSFDFQQYYELPGKGNLNNLISQYFFKKINDRGIETHFEKIINMREQMVRRAIPFQFFVKIRNFAAGSICERLGLEEGLKFPKPILEFCFKNPLISTYLNGYVSENYILSFNWLEFYELEEIKLLAYRINDFLSGILLALNIELIDLQLEFGKIFSTYEESIILIDEITPDNARFIDLKTGLKLGREYDEEGVENSNQIYGYEALANRLFQ